MFRAARAAGDLPGHAPRGAPASSDDAAYTAAATDAATEASGSSSGASHARNSTVDLPAIRNVEECSRTAPSACSPAVSTISSHFMP